MNTQHSSILATDLQTEDSIDIAQLRTPIKVDLSPIYNFLGSRTSQTWIEAALVNHSRPCELRKKSGRYSDELDVPL